MLRKFVWLNQSCRACGSQLNSWDLRVSKALGYYFPLCESCVAAEHGISIKKLKATCKAHFEAFPCLGRSTSK